MPATEWIFSRALLGFSHGKPYEDDFPASVYILGFIAPTLDFIIYDDAVITKRTNLGFV